MIRLCPGCGIVTVPHKCTWLGPSVGRFDDVPYRPTLQNITDTTNAPKVGGASFLRLDPASPHLVTLRTICAMPAGIARELATEALCLALGEPTCSRLYPDEGILASGHRSPYEPRDGYDAHIEVAK